MLGSGAEERNARWADSRRSYNAGYGVKSLNDLHAVIAFFEERRGRLHGFRWRDPSDWKSCPPESSPTALDQQIGTGNGAASTFQLTKTYGSAFNPWIRPAPGGTIVIVGQPFALFLDLPLLRGDEPPYAGYVAAAQNPWPGAVAFYRSPENSNFLLKAVVPAPATTGVTLDALPAAATSRYDHASSVRVALDQGALASVTELALLAGANTAAVQNADGDWEVLQFQSAVLVDASTYKLSLFLRGQAGSDAAMRSPLPAGARFVLLDGAVTAVDMAPGEIGLGYTWRCGPSNRDLGNPSYVQTTHAFTGEGQKPLSPAHIRGTRSAGDLAISWVRRTRVGGDSWDAVEVPLAEETERYEIDILDGAVVKRTLASTTPSATYTAAQQTADFGAPQPSVALRVYQLSVVFGRGTAREATL